MFRIVCLWVALLLTFLPVRPALAAPAGGGAAAAVTAVRMGASPEKLRIVVDTDKEVDYATMVLSDPGRVVIDLHGAQLGPDIARETPLESRFASRVRVGQFKEDTVRIVVETSLGKGDFDVFSIEGGPVPYRIVMDFGQVGTGHKDFGHGAEPSGNAPPPGNDERTERPGETIAPAPEKSDEGAQSETEKPDGEAKPEGAANGETIGPETGQEGEGANAETEQAAAGANPENGETPAPEAEKNDEGASAAAEKPDENAKPETGEDAAAPRPSGTIAPTPSARGKGGSRDVTGAPHQAGDSGPSAKAGEKPPAGTEPSEQEKPETQKTDEGEKEKPETRKKDEEAKADTDKQKKDEAEKEAAGQKPEDEDDKEALSEDVAFPPGIKGKVIAIDPGHGGEDSGAIGPSGVMEKTVTLRIAKEVEALLKEAGAKVVMTRTTDTEVSPKHRQATDVDELQARCDVANKAKADIFVSIHMDSFTSREATGTTGYYYLKGSVASRRLAEAIQSNLVRQLRTASRGVKTCRFYVVRHTKMPAMLIEVAFLSNPKEEKLLTSEKGVKRAATGIVQGIAEFFGT